MNTKRHEPNKLLDARSERTRHIGNRIRAQRQLHGISLAQLSERTGGQLKKSRISNYEQGLRRLGIEEAQILAQAFETVSPAWLLCLDGAETMASLSTDEAELLAAFRAADDGGKRMILSSARAIGE